MKVKTFHALSMQDALREIKEELGPDAIILSSKEVREDGRMIRLFNRPILEVMAACEQPPLQDVPSARKGRPNTGVRQHANPQAAPGSSGQGFQETLQAILNPASLRTVQARDTRAVHTTVPTPDGWKQTRLRELRAELSELSRLLEGWGQGLTSIGEAGPTVVTTLRGAFTQRGIHPSTPESLCRDVSQVVRTGAPRSAADMGVALQDTLACRITIDPSLFGDNRRAMVLVLGPSGSGKTSAVAKLAVRSRREGNRTVAVVAFDTGLTEPNGLLRQHARELGIPFAAARSARQLAEGVRRHTRADLFVIDMPSIESGGSLQAESLCRLLGDEWDITTQLVVPASASEQELRRVAEQAARLPSLRWLFTRLDDPHSYGTIAELGCYAGIPLSYWSIGRQVPDDIEPASLERLAESLMARRDVTAAGPVPQRSVPSSMTAEQERADVCLQSIE